MSVLYRLYTHKPRRQTFCLYDGLRNRTVTRMASELEREIRMEEDKGGTDKNKRKRGFSSSGSEQETSKIVVGMIAVSGRDGVFSDQHEVARAKGVVGKVWGSCLVEDNSEWNGHN